MNKLIKKHISLVKAESLTINSIGQRPMNMKKIITNGIGQRPVINNVCIGRCPMLVDARLSALQISVLIINNIFIRLCPMRVDIRLSALQFSLNLITNIGHRRPIN